MAIIHDLLFVAGGLVILLVAGELLVRGASSLARLLGIPSLLIGLTIVAFGTSAPELVVSVQAVLAGDNGIAIGNIVGSNIANILLVLGLPALVCAISLANNGLRRHVVVMLIATGAFAWAVYGRGQLDNGYGVVLLGGIIAYTLYVIVSAMRGGRDDAPIADSSVIDELGDSGHPSVPKTALFVVLGLIGLPLGATLLVNNGASLAMTLGVREELVGLTIIAFGTSLPELATVWAAARKGEADVAVGNVVGSNIFNILFVGGATGLAGVTAFTDPLTRTLDVPVMIGAAILLAVIAFMRGRINAALGGMMFLGYILYLVVVTVLGDPQV